MVLSPPSVSSGADGHEARLGTATPPELVTAMASERSGIERALRRENLSPALRVRKLGVGAQAGPAWKASLADRPAPSALVSMGFACGLHEACGLGHVVLSHTLLAQQETESLHSDPCLLEMAAEACQHAGMPYHIGPSLTALKPVLNSAEKERFGVQTGALSCAMEDYWLAREAGQAGVPFLSARVVLDPVKQDIPVAVGDMACSQGLTMALRLLGQSWRLPLLLRLAFQSVRAQGYLGRFAMAFCSQLIQPSRPEFPFPGSAR